VFYCQQIFYLKGSKLFFLLVKIICWRKKIEDINIHELNIKLKNITLQGLPWWRLL